MKSKNRPHLRLESLEARWVPATIQYSGGNLYISAIKNAALTVTESASGNTFTVTDGAGNNGSYAVSGNITITAGTASANTSISVGVNSGTGLTGNLTINADNKVTTVTVDGTDGAAGLIAGNTQISLGTGGGTVNLGTTKGLNDRGTLSVTAGTNSSNSIAIGGGASASTFAGSSLSFTNFNSVLIGNTGAGVADSIPANITVNAANNGNNGTVTLGKLENVRGNFSIYEGTGSSTVAINGAAVGGTLTVNVKGPSSLAFGSGTATTVGSLNYTSLNGNTSFTASNAAGTAVTASSANFNWGNGANSFGSSSSFTVTNNFYVTNGNGGLDINTNAFQGNVGGTFTVNSGNGTSNAVTLNNTAAEAGGGTGVTAFNYGQNNGGNSVTITDGGSEVVTLNINFGSSGANLFTISAGTTAALTGQVAWSTSTLATAGNGFANPGNYVFTLPWSFINEPS